MRDMEKLKKVLVSWEEQAEGLKKEIKTLETELEIANDVITSIRRIIEEEVEKLLGV